MEAALIGAGLGAAGSALTGQNLLKGAALGGLTGGTLGGSGSLLGQTALGQSLFGTAAGTVPASQVGKQVLANSIDDMGLVFNPATGTYLNPANFAFANTSNPLFTGGQGILSNAYDMASNAIPSMLKEQMTPANLYGVSKIIADTQTRPLPAPPSASGRGGSAVQYQPMSVVAIPQQPKRNLIIG